MPEPTSPVCRLDIYKQLNLPLPDPSNQSQPEQSGSKRCPRAKGGNEGPICKRDIFKQMGLPIPGEKMIFDDMETTVYAMEQEVRTMQGELETVQAERLQLEMQKRLLHCAAPTIATSDKQNAVSGPLNLPGASLMGETTEESTQVSRSKLETAEEDWEDQEWRQLDAEYRKLLHDYNSKVEEVSSLRVEVEESKRVVLASARKSEQADSRVEDLEARLKSFEEDSIKGTSNKNKMIELHQQLAMADRMFEKSIQEHEGLLAKATMQTNITKEYRMKYLDSEQCAEEQRHKIEMLERDRTRFADTITLELQKIKAQFQSKLEEMTLLPDLINKTKEKLKEVEEIKKTAEKNCIIISMNLDEAKAEKDILQKQLDEVNKNRSKSEAENYSIKNCLSAEEKKVEETKTENKDLKVKIAQYQELAVINGRKYEEETENGVQLKRQLETLRQQSARQIAKTKDKFEKTKCMLQDQVANLEKQLASMRALEKTALQDRNEIREKMQTQITKLNENFEEAQNRIRSIQSHVNYLKSSYTNMLNSE